MSPPSERPFAKVLPELLERISALPSGEARKLVAIAGVPAGGKSTLADVLTEALQSQGVNAVNVPMDGFHLDNRILEARGLKARKGAPETFDAAGFLSLVARMKSEDEVIYPLFDRGRDIAIAGAGLLPKECDVVVIEGNYLLFDDAPWRELAGLWDLSVRVETSEDVVLDRCVQRWLAHGHTPEAARERALRNDVANAKRINAARLPSDVAISEKTAALPI